MTDAVITDEHAVVIQELPEVARIGDYLNSVAEVVGADKIHSVIKENGEVKIFLKEKKYVLRVQNDGIVLPYRTNVKTFMNNACKVILSNVDPIVPDEELLCLLSPYGNLLSDVIHEKISNNNDFCHIIGPNRYVYMERSCVRNIPRKLVWICDDKKFFINVNVEISCDQTAQSNAEIHRTAFSETNVSMVEEGIQCNIMPVSSPVDGVIIEGYGNSKVTSSTSIVEVDSDEISECENEANKSSGDETSECENGTNKNSDDETSECENRRDKNYDEIIETGTMPILERQEPLNNGVATNSIRDKSHPLLGASTEKRKKNNNIGTRVLRKNIMKHELRSGLERKESTNHKSGNALHAHRQRGKSRKKFGFFKPVHSQFGKRRKSKFFKPISRTLPERTCKSNQGSSHVNKRGRGRPRKYENPIKKEEHKEFDVSSETENSLNRVGNIEKQTGQFLTVSVPKLDDIDLSSLKTRFSKKSSSSSTFDQNTDMLELREGSSSCKSPDPNKLHFSSKKLEDFLNLVKHHRAPLDVAQQFLSENGTPNALKELVLGLEDYANNSRDICLKLRVGRLVTLLSE